MERLCVCGHPRNEHYEYWRNNRRTTRCRACDPFAYARSENIAVDADSYLAAMNEAADHPYQEAA